MIVTRRRKPRTHPERVVLPLLLVAVIGFVLGFPPSRNAIATGPLAPLWNAGASVAGGVVRPLSFAGQQETITQRNREIRDLNARLEAERAAKEDAESRVQELQAQVSAMAHQPLPTPIPVPRGVPPAAAATIASIASDEDKRLAATWAAMEPERAAALVQRLPQAQAGRVLAQMDAASAGAIMDALPAGVAARITRAQAQVR